MNQPAESSSPNPDERVGIKHFIKEIQLINGEVIKLPSLHIERLKLFSGSPVPGLETFRDSEETTVGSGVYLTSQKEAARGYALVRGSRLPAIPTLYEVEIADMDMVDLATRVAVESFAKLWRQELENWRETKLPIINVPHEMVRETYEERVQKVIEFIDRNSFRYLRDLTFNFGGLIREVFTRQEYDGLIAIEGGESGNGVTIGDHDSYVIFDSTKVKKVGEEPLRTSS